MYWDRLDGLPYCFATRIIVSQADVCSRARIWYEGKQYRGVEEA